MPRTAPLKYQPLADYLVALPPETETVTLTFAAIEALLGAPLPRSAYRQTFWANARGPNGTSQARAWQGAGWRAAGLRRGPGPWAVTFVRADMASGGEAGSR